ncbi:hypothetical protein L1D14_10355 [Vibrio tubiashii]|uniref:hypothetical protein n=1 Tax=Vibrio tubiashii TaxID=29498 RepID=UPI001EFE046C|nr:hypothetical protein [Vibrio tubiashii]MCG9576638.1 hypothetical protein [Vibrio tubiashii]
MELVKVLKTVSKLNGTEDEAHLMACGASHMMMRENGLLTSTITFDRQGNPDSIETLWVISPIIPKTESEELPKGQRVAYIPKPMFDMLVHERCIPQKEPQS